MNFQSSVNRALGSIATVSTAKKFTPKNILTEKQDQAIEKVKQIQEAKTKQRRNFMDYLSKMPTSLGGTVGELPKDVQKTIASTYSKSQRRTLMDRMDRENGKK